MNTKRLFAFIIDWIILSIIGISAVFIYTEIKQQISPQIILRVTMFAYIIFLFRDIIGGASIGKRIFNLYIGNSNEPIRPIKKYKLILRNFTCIIWPVEGILLLTTGKRIGDYMTNTTVYSIGDRKI